MTHKPVPASIIVPEHRESTNSFAVTPTVRPIGIDLRLAKVNHNWYSSRRFCRRSTNHSLMDMKLHVLLKTLYNLFFRSISVALTI